MPVCGLTCDLSWKMFHMHMRRSSLVVRSILDIAASRVFIILVKFSFSLLIFYINILLWKVVYWNLYYCKLFLLTILSFFALYILVAFCLFASLCLFWCSVVYWTWLSKHPVYTSAFECPNFWCNFTQLLPIAFDGQLCVLNIISCPRHLQFC